MDGNNYENQQGTQSSAGSNGQSNYQDNTANYANQTPVGTGNQPGDNKANGLQIAGLVCGILGICASCCYGIPGIILGGAGLICAVLGNKESKSGVGIAGLVCSIIGVILGVIILIYFIWIFSQLGELGYWELLEEMGYY